MILLVNDDGIDAPGLRVLYRALRGLGVPVLAVAPAVERSGQGHAITIDRPLTARPRQEAGFFGFAIDGTPADCVKLAVDRLCPQRPSLVVSGINRGPNVGRSLFYSGTVAAAMEAAILGLPALAVSRQLGDGDLEAAARLAAGWAGRLRGRKDLVGRVANLNVPAGAAADWGPLVLARHGKAGFDEHYRSVALEGGRGGWLLEGSWSEQGEQQTDAAMLAARRPVLSLLAPDFNHPDGWLRRLADDAGATPHG